MRRSIARNLGMAVLPFLVLATRGIAQDAPPMKMSPMLCKNASETF